MSQTAVLVWLSAATVLPTFRADLDAFAQSRLLRLEAPRENAAAFRSSAYAPDVVAQVEASLEEARNASASLEQSRALAALERADHLLREHPELPQSAWLMAERLDLAADVESSAPDGAETALGLRKRAAALEGARAPLFSDHAANEAIDAPAPHALVLEGVEPSDTLEWDGVQSRPEFETAEGEHHARITRSGHLMWAGWVHVAIDETRVRLPVPETVACSADDVNAAHFEGGRVIAPPHARCESYVVARARATGGIEAAQCERSACGPIVIWEQAHPAHAVRAEHSGWPRWATYTALSAGAAVIAGVVLWRAGVFDRDTRTTTSWVYQGQENPMARF